MIRPAQVPLKLKKKEYISLCNCELYKFFKWVTKLFLIEKPFVYIICSDEHVIKFLKWKL